MLLCVFIHERNISPSPFLSRPAAMDGTPAQGRSLFSSSIALRSVSLEGQAPQRLASSFPLFMKPKPTNRSARLKIDSSAVHIAPAGGPSQAGKGRICANDFIPAVSGSRRAEARQLVPGLLSDQGFNLLEHLQHPGVAYPIEHPNAVLPRGEYPGPPEHLKVARDRGLIELEVWLDLAATQLTFGDEAKNPEACGVGQGLQELRGAFVSQKSVLHHPRLGTGHGNYALTCIHS